MISIKKILAGILCVSIVLTPNSVTCLAEETDFPEIVTEEQDAIENSESDESTGYIPLQEEYEVEAIDETDILNSDITGLCLYSASSIEDYYVNEKLSSIRNQNPYGSCWSFAATGLAEADLLNSGYSSIDLSELHLAYFTYNSVQDPLGGTLGDSNSLASDCSYNFLDRGGNLVFALSTLAKWMGAADESTADYSTADVSISSGLDSSIAYADVAHLQNAYMIDIYENSDQVKSMIKEYGAASISYYANSNYYNSTNNCYYSGKSSSYANHAVMIVGWDDTFSSSNFTNDPGEDGAWLVRNSWGSYDDEYNNDGYFWMSYAETSIVDTAYVFDFVGSEEDGYYDNNYQYDGGMVSGYYSGTDTITEANVFEASSGTIAEEIEAVSFMTDNADLDYTVDIYTDLSSTSDPESGVLAATLTGTTTFEGYYTVELENSVSIDNGDVYSVVITLAKEGEDIHAVCEISSTYSGWYASEVRALSNQSFLLYNGSYYDWGENQNCNFRIKAFTNNSTEESYDITYTLNGGTNNVNNPSRYTSSSDSITLQKPTRKGYTFVGWYTDSDFKTEISEIPTGSMGNITLYAKWSKTTYSITYNLRSGTNSSSNPTTYTYTTATITLENPTKKGYTFDGWYSDSNCTIQVTQILKGSIGNKKLYAKWTANKYTIKFSGNTSTSGSMSSISSCKYGKSYTLTANVYKRTGYAFIGWNTKADGSGTTYADGASVMNLSTKFGGSVTLYAQWKKEKYTITYNLRSGTNNSSNPSTYTYTTATITLENPTRKGYTFKGWYSDSACSKKVTEIKKGSTGNKKLYAKWSVNKYTITFNGNGATSGSMASLTSCKYGTSYTLSSNAYKRKGYTFVGWNTKADGSGKLYKNKASVKNLSSKSGDAVILYAQWE